MKIAYLMQEGVPDLRQCPPSGPANHVIQVFKELKNQGNQLCLIACMNEKILKSDDLVNYCEIHARWLNLGTFRLIESLLRRVQFELKLPYFALFASIRFAQACQQELAGYDIFYERMGWMGYGGTLASRRMGIPLILEINGDHLDELKMLRIEPHGIQRWLSLFIMRIASKTSSLFCDNRRRLAPATYATMGNRTFQN